MASKKIYGLFGYPVRHSKSPLMHNRWFKELGINAEYRLFEVPPHELLLRLTRLYEDGISGINVTIPHKEAALRCMSTLSEEAKLAVAVNTVVVEENALHGFNTDVYGFLTSLKNDLKVRPKGKRALVLGAGGAGRAVSVGLCMEQIAELFIFDIAAQKKEELTAYLKKKFKKTAVAALANQKECGEKLKGCGLLVNASPCGMRAEDPLPIAAEALHKKLKVFDLVYNPAATKLVEAAREKGLAAAGGLNMLIYQGAKSFEIWTGKTPPVESIKAMMRQSVI